MQTVQAIRLVSRDAHVVGHVLDVLCPVLVPVTVVAVLAVSDALVVITAEFVLVATDAAPAVVATVHARLDVTAVATRACTQIYSVASNIVLC